MKTIKIITLFLILFNLSCSSDEDEQEEMIMENPINTIVGVWDLTDIIPLENGTDEQLADSQELQTILPLLNCNLISFDFRADNSLELVVFEAAMVQGSDPNNPDFECVNFESGIGEYNLNGNTIAISSTEFSSVSFTFRFENNNNRLFIVPGQAFGELGELATEFIFDRIFSQG